MSIATYAELKTAIADYLHRSGLTASIPDIVTMAEGRLNRNLKLLQSQQTAALVGVVGSRFVALPARFQEAVTLTITPSGGVPQFIPYRDGFAFDNRIQTSNGRPDIFRVDTQIEFDSPCDQAYAIAFRYIKKWDIAADSTNWLLTNWPDLYLHACMWSACFFTGDWALQDRMLSALAQEVEEANKIDGNTRGRAILAVSMPGRGDGSRRIEQDGQY